MSHKDSLFKAELYIADLDRQYYCDHQLRLARYPNESLEQMMLRLLAFTLFAHRELKFTPFQGAQQEAHLLQANEMEEIENWIILGQPNEKLLKRACDRSPHVAVINLDDKMSDSWWQRVHNRIAPLDGLQVIRIPREQLENLTTLCARNMKLQINILDGEVLVRDHISVVSLRPEILKQASTAEAA